MYINIPLRDCPSLTPIFVTENWTLTQPLVPQPGSDRLDSPFWWDIFLEMYNDIHDWILYLIIYDCT